MLALRFKIADESDGESWNEFVTGNSPSAFFSLYMLFEWRNVLAKSYGYDPYYIIAEENAEIVGCFPLMFVKSALMSSRMVSLPFTDHGCGPCVSGRSEGTLRALLGEAERLAFSKSSSIKLNSPQDWMSNILYDCGYERFYDYYTFTLDLSRPVDGIWAGFEKDVRTSIRKAEKSGVRVYAANTEESFERVHSIHVDNMRRLGTPPHSKKFFVEMFNQMGPKNLVCNFMAQYEGKDIASIVLFPHRDSVRWGAGVMRSEYRPVNPIYLLLWEGIKWSKQKGYAVFDMGGSRPDSGNYRFKEAWLGKKCLNGQVVKLNHFHRFLGNRRGVVGLESSKYRWFSALWRRCVPSSIARILGPQIRKQIAS